MFDYAWLRKTKASTFNWEFGRFHNEAVGRLNGVELEDSKSMVESMFIEDVDWYGSNAMEACDIVDKIIGKLKEDNEAL